MLRSLSPAPLSHSSLITTFLFIDHIDVLISRKGQGEKKDKEEKKNTPVSFQLQCLPTNRIGYLRNGVSWPVN